MNLWGKSKENNGGGAAVSSSGDFDAAAARVTAEAEVSADSARQRVAETAENGDRLEIRPEWANAAARLCFLPAAKLSHPAYALTEEEAETIAPQMQQLLQAVADKYAPAVLGRVATRHPEFFDAAAAVGVLYYQKWRIVTRLRQEEAVRQAAAQAEAKSGGQTIDVVPVMAARPKPGERDADGTLII